MKTVRFTRSVRLGVSVKTAFRWHIRPGVFERLTPSWQDAAPLSTPPELRDGAEFALRVQHGPFRLRWTGRPRDVQPPTRFVGERQRGPFSPWIHTHRFEEEDLGGCRLTDDVEFRLPFGLGAEWIRAELRRIFRYRHSIIRHDLRAHAAAPDRSMRILVTGSRGLLGSHLVPFLIAGGHRIARLLHLPHPEFPDALNLGSGPVGAWEGLDAVVHLAGANLAARRWTAERKRVLRASRVEFTARLAERLAALAQPPRVVICASATGWYGNGQRGQAVSEGAPAGNGFLADLTRDWDAAAAPLRRAGIRVVHLRFGMILSPRGGALRKLLPVFRAGLGGPIGDGRQWVSWIAMDDALDVILRAIWRRELTGPLNAVAPYPVSNASFATAIGRVLGRPASRRAPAPLLRVVFGEMADALLLDGVQALPTRLMEDGFSFRLPTLEAALRHMLGRYLPLSAE